MTENYRINGGPALADPHAGAPDLVPPYASHGNKQQTFLKAEREE